MKSLDERSNNGDYRRFQIAYLMDKTRGEKEKKSQGWGYHAKWLAVDKEIVSIGSHNLYKTGEKSKENELKKEVMNEKRHSSRGGEDEEEKKSQWKGEEKKRLAIKDKRSYEKDEEKTECGRFAKIRKAFDRE